LRSEEAHKIEAVDSGFCIKTEVGILCEDRWNVCQKLLEQAKSDLEAFEETNIKKPSDLLREQDIMIIREGLMLIVQCRRVLKWCCV